MDSFSFVFTIFFMLLGPVKTIPAFAALTKGADSRFKRDVAIRAALIASGIGVFLILAGEYLLGRYHISLDALRLSGGLVLLLAALNVIFPRSQAPSGPSGAPSALHVAVSPVASPIIIPPAGVAAILIFAMLAPEYPGIVLVIFICLAIMMVLNFLVMHFIDKVASSSGLMLTLQVLGSVLVFMQIGLAMETMLEALRSLGVVAA